VAEVQEWIATMARELSPATVRKYLDALPGLLDFLGVEPNPARGPRLSLPRLEEEEVSPPSRARDHPREPASAQPAPRPDARGDRPARG
jgi:hypothetical protein